MPDKAQELLTCFEQAAVNTAATEQLRAGWNELCINTGIYSISFIIIIVIAIISYFAFCYEK